MDPFLALRVALAGSSVSSQGFALPRAMTVAAAPACQGLGFAAEAVLERAESRPGLPGRTRTNAAKPDPRIPACHRGRADDGLDGPPLPVFPPPAHAAGA